LDLRKLKQSRKRDRSTVAAQEKESIRSQILDHLVDRVKDHDSKRHSRKDSKSNVNGVLARLNVVNERGESSQGSKRIGLKNNRTNYANPNILMTQESWKSGFHHYDNSPVAKHYYQDPGFLMTYDGTIGEKVAFNRKIKMRDTFTKIFPSYTHVNQTCYSPSHTHAIHFYPSKLPDGSPTHQIDRRFTHKMDEIKTYTEEMLKIADIADMRRPPGSKKK
jgi:hypothetical protein